MSILYFNILLKQFFLIINLPSMPNQAVSKNVNLEYILYVVQKIMTSQTKFTALIYIQKRRQVTKCRIAQQRNLHNHQISN
jgi:hypothetical protein